MSGRRSDGEITDSLRGGDPTYDAGENRYANSLNYRSAVNQARPMIHNVQPQTQQQHGQTSVKDVLDQLARLILKAQ